MRLTCCGAALLALLAAATTVPAEQALRLPAGARPLSYAAELTLRPDAATFEGRIRIEIEIETAQPKLWLNATELTVTRASVSMGGTTESADVRLVGDDHLTLDVGRSLPPGPISVTLDYSGLVSDSTSDGLFRQTEGSDAYLFSNFEPIDARRVFPCFDEPSFKVPWELTLRVPSGLLALSNEPVVEETTDAETGLTRFRFAPTPPLPSYLVAVGVGPFDVVDAGKAGRKGTPIRIVTPRGKGGEARFAAQVTGEILEQLESYFGTPYPFRKLDQLAIPLTVSFSAMEQPGLITYSSRVMLARPDSDTVARQRRYAVVAAHELAHQWFGNLVTTAWWDDIWLNEAFASWMEDKIVAAWRPAWGGAAERVSARGWPLSSDGLRSARRIRQPIESKDDIDNAFDGITYVKGQAVLEMFEAWVGAEPFRQGVRRFLEQHAWGSATSADFLETISQATRPELGPALASFLDQPGIPLVRASLQCTPDGARVALSQRRYLSAGDASTDIDAQSWQIPVCVRHADGRACALLRERTGLVELDGASCPEWVVVNASGVGYFRVQYDPGMAQALAADGGARLEVAERIQLVSDVSALAGSGEMPIEDALAVVAQVVARPERHVVAAATNVVARLQDDLVSPERQANYRRFVQKLFGPLAQELGLTPAAGESEETRLLRPDVVTLVAGAGEDTALRAEALRLTRAWLADRRAVEPDVLDVVLRVAATDGDEALYKALSAAWKAGSDRRERASLLGALASFRDPALLRRSLELIMAPDSDPRETMGVFWRILRGGRVESRRAAYAFLVDNYAAFLARVPREGRGYLPATAGAGCDEAARRQAESFWKDKVDELEGAPRVLDQTLERISLCTQRRQAQQPGVDAFLAGY